MNNNHEVPREIDFIRKGEDLIWLASRDQRRLPSGDYRINGVVYRLHNDGNLVERGAIKDRYGNKRIGKWSTYYWRRVPTSTLLTQLEIAEYRTVIDGESLVRRWVPVWAVLVYRQKNGLLSPAAIHARQLPKGEVK